MKSNKEIVNALRAAPDRWTDTAIVVVFENRFEFVGEDHPDPMNRLSSLQAQGGLAIGLAGVSVSAYADRSFRAQLFQEFEGQGWAHRSMDKLRRMSRRPEFL
jgi:hypothetical protein